jgi:PAS domain S-box-containing protein
MGNEDGPLSELQELRARLREAEESLAAIRGGEVDAVVVPGPAGQQIYTITNADRPYRLLIEQMKEGAVTLLSTGIIVYCNEAFSALLGLDAAEVCGMRLQQFVSPTEVSSLEALVASEGGGRSVFTLLDSAQSEVPVHASMSRLPDIGDGPVVCGIITDLREIRRSRQQLADTTERLADQINVRERAEALLHQSQKMEVVGQLTGGLAHDFNNLLMIIGGNLDLIRRRVKDEKIEQKIEQVLSAVQRGAKLTQQLLAFSRIQTLSPETICIKRLVFAIEMLLRRAVGPEIDVQFAMPDSLWFCRADPNQLESAILNLAINARDAMGAGGLVRIEGSNVVVDQEAANALGDIEPGRYVALTLTDNGSGMSADVLSRVFEPFYTTKEVGKGSGLGLSQVYGFVRQSGGHVAIRSEVAKGTSVRLYLPWAEAVNSVGTKTETIEAHPPPIDFLKILVVEDDTEVRELATQLINELGYTSRAACTGEEAMAVLQSDPSVGLLFTDILMPGKMNGIELSAQACTLRPDLGVLMTSGFPGHFLPGAPLNSRFETIRKPFTQAELGAALLRARVNKERGETKMS